MTDINKAKEIIKSIGRYTDEDLLPYCAIIQNAYNTVVSNLHDSLDMGDSRIIYLIAARANYEIALCRYGSDGVTSFKAGDISIKQSNDALKYARLLFDNARADCIGLLIDDGFAFLGV